MVVLTKDDVGVLCTTLKSICSKEPNICISGIRFLHDVVLKDFPAELFLQRTDFIENLFRILNEKNLEIAYSATSCLISLCRALITRIYYHLDPNNYVYSSRKLTFLKKWLISFIIRFYTCLWFRLMEKAIVQIFTTRDMK
ncbi:unnamed protein product [Schistosoma curassoni]|uniref:Serine/threonine-protein kinase ATR (Trinotate prediction) n=1 Tax=Schistosoma curassoni TaxID=6186 RepID=A0A183K4W6_9TREM|nr:unnamed protein product [Schistosoma curassoni]